MKKENPSHTWVKDEYFDHIMESYTIPKDISESPRRTLLYSYHPNTEKPLIYRHYQHVLDIPMEFDTYKKLPTDNYTVFVVSHQNVQLIINEEAYMPLPGDIVILRKGSVFQPIFFSVNHFDYYEINIPEEYFNLVPASSPVHSLFLDKENKDNNFLSPSDESKEEIARIFQKIDSILEQNHKHKDFLIYSYLMRLFAFIDNNVIPEVKHTQKIKSSPIIREAAEYITENYLTISGVDEVANHCHISVSYLCRIFKKQLGISPIEFINSRKIIHAEHLLKIGYNVMDVCFASGFNSYNYFISLFKKTTGQTPAKYRKLAAEQDLI